MATTRNSPNIAYVRPEFTDLKSRWDLIRDCIAGEEQVKKRKDAYLPRPNPSDTSAQNTTRYDQYLTRAVFYNVTGRTLKGMVGQVVSESPNVKLPKLLTPLEPDIDGAGVTLEQQANLALAHTLAYGRCGLLVDYPVVDGAATKAQLDKAQIRPLVSLVEPWDIINWRTQTFGGVNKLSLVVLSEQYVLDDDGFEQECDDQWRVLRLDEDGLYVMEEWIRDPDNKNEYILKPVSGGAAQYMPLDSKGQRLNYIPFQFIGASNNDHNADLPPLYDLAAINVAHYRNSADYEEACYICGQPTPYFSGLTEDWVKTVMKGAVHLGSRAAVLLPEGGNAGMLQAAANSMPKEAMEAKERQMVALGAKLVEQQAVQRTATEAGIEEAAESCVLGTIAKNVSSAYTSALSMALNFLDSGEPEVVFELNTEFAITSLSAQDRAQAISEWQTGAITDEEMRGYLVRSGVAYEDIDSWRDKAETELMSRPIAGAVAPTKQSPAEEENTVIES